MEKKVIIIGGGVAGLSAGIYGQINGYETEILEMHSLPGGQCTAWKRKDYTFDYCIHWLVGSSHGAFHDIWKETGALNGATDIVNPETYVTIRLPDGEDFMKYKKMSIDDYFRGLNFQSQLMKDRMGLISTAMSDFSAIAFLFTLVWFSQKNAGWTVCKQGDPKSI